MPSRSLPEWFTDRDVLSNKFVVKRFLGKNYFEKCSLQMHLQDMRKKVAVECVLTFEVDIVAEKLAFYLNSDLDDSLTKVRSTKRASIIMQSRSRAKTLQNQKQSGNFFFMDDE